MAKAPSQRAGQQEEEAVLNITSLIDVLTILLVFLLKSYSAEPQGNITISKQITLPVSISNQTIHQQKTSVTITNQAILVDNKDKVASIGQGWTVEGVDKQNPFKLEALIDKLNKVADQKKYIAAHNSSFKFDGEILIMADRNMPSRVLATILYSVGQAGFDKIKLIAINSQT